MEESMELTPEQKLEMSLEEIIWYEKQRNNWNGPSSMKSVRSHCTSNRSDTSTPHVPIFYGSQNGGAQFGQYRNQCVYESRPRFNYPMYRKSVRKAVQTLLSRSQQGYRRMPYKTMLSAMSDRGVSVQNNNYLKNLYVRKYQNRSDSTMDLEMPVRNDLDYDYKKFPRFLFMGTKVIVTRHSIKNKLNRSIQEEVKKLSLSKSARVKLYKDLDFCPIPHTTQLLINERFTFNG